MRDPVVSVEVYAIDRLEEITGSGRYLCPQSPIDAAQLIRRLVNDAMAALMSCDPEEEWQFRVEIDVCRQQDITPATRRFCSWLREQGTLPAMNWKREPLVRLLPPEQTEEGKSNS